MELLTKDIFSEYEKAIIFLNNNKIKTKLDLLQYGVEFRKLSIFIQIYVLSLLNRNIEII